MEFVTIRTGTLRGDYKIDFDLYIVVANKHIIYLRKGDSFEGSRLLRLKEKKLKKLFIRPEEEEAYLKYVSGNIDQAYDAKSNTPIEDRAEIIQGAQQSSAEAVMETPEDITSYKIARDGAGRYVEFLLKEEKAVKAMLSIENVNRDLAQHGVTVSTLSIAIAHKLGIQNQQQTQLLALGALLHDFGHTNSEYPLFKPLTEIDEKGRFDYIRHPSIGVEAMQHHQHFDQAVISIVSQHEELADGSGYPNRFKEAQTDPLALIASTANDFDRLMLNEKLSQADALKKFISMRVGAHPMSHLSALKSLYS